MYDIFLEFSAKVERLSKMYTCELMDSPIIAIGKVEALKTLVYYKDAWVEKKHIFILYGHFTSHL